jgi:hypothetical protein
MPLDVCDNLSRIGLVPAPIEVLGSDPELDEQVAGKVLRLRFAPFFALASALQTRLPI